MGSPSENTRKNFNNIEIRTYVRTQERFSRLAVFIVFVMYVFNESNSSYCNSNDGTCSMQSRHTVLILVLHRRAQQAGRRQQPGATSRPSAGHRRQQAGPDRG